MTANPAGVDSVNAEVDLAQTAAHEWSSLVTAAVLGTDRRPPPRPTSGWGSLRHVDDPALELLDRAASVATARRAGVKPSMAPPPVTPAPFDGRPVCPDRAADILGVLLKGTHDILLPEWMALCAASRLQPPRHFAPTLLLRGRRHPGFDLVVRALIGPLAGWLAEAMPELGVPVTPKPANAVIEAYLPPTPPADSGAVVSAIITTFADRSATWAAVAQLRQAVAAIEPRWLPALILELNRVPFHAMTERTRVELIGLAEIRREMVVTLDPAPNPSRGNFDQ